MSKLALFSVLIVMLSMYPQIHSFGIVRVNVQKDPAILNAIGSAISTKIQSLNSILSSILALKSSYKTVNINSSYGASTGGSSVVYNTVPLYKKTVNVNYGVAPIANTIEDSSDDASSQTTSGSSSVGAVGQTIYTATKVIGGVAAVAPAAAVSSESVATSSASGTATVASSPVGYSYSKIIG